MDPVSALAAALDAVARVDRERNGPDRNEMANWEVHYDLPMMLIPLFGGARDPSFKAPSYQLGSDRLLTG
jgi:hypothetical protein